MDYYAYFINSNRFTTECVFEIIGLERIIPIVVEPVGLVGNRGNAASAAGGLKAVGRLAVNSF